MSVQQAEDYLRRAALKASAQNNEALQLIALSLIEILKEIERMGQDARR